MRVLRGIRVGEIPIRCFDKRAKQSHSEIADLISRLQYSLIHHGVTETFRLVLYQSLYFRVLNSHTVLGL